MKDEDTIEKNNILEGIEENKEKTDIAEEKIEDVQTEILEEKLEDKKIEISQEKTKKQKLKLSAIIAKILGYSIIILVIIILIRALVYKKYDIFGHSFYIIMSGSMEPTISVSDGIITKETNDLKDGDIIAFDNQGAVTVHRIIKTYTQENGEKLYRTKGDNNNSADRGLISKTQIKGEVIYKVPKIGNAVLFLQRNIVIILILILGVTIIIYLVRRLI